MGQTFTAAQDSQDVISPAKAQRAEHDLGIAGVYWWGRCLGERQGAFWLDAIDAQALNSQPVRRRIGYLNTLEDLLQHLGHKMERYLPELLALTAVLLQGAVDSEGEEGAKEVRSRCLRLAAAVLERFSGAIDYNFLWDPLFTASAPLMDRIATEASADKAPPVVQLCAALASAPQLVPVLADGQSLVGTSAPDAAVPVVASSQPWAAEHHLGSRLLSRCVAALSASTCAEPTRTTMLDALESIFDLQDPLPEQVLGAHTPDLLAGLQAIVVAVWKQGSGGDQHSRKKLPGASGAGGRPSGPPRRATATRALAILELVGGRTSDWGTAAQLTDALLPLVQPQGGSKGRKRADEELIARALDALTALWSRLAALSSPEQVALQRDRLEHIAAAVAPLAGSLASREARHALCAAFSTTASLLPEELAGADALLTGLNAMSTTEIDEPDYERRMGAYGQLTPERWGSFSLLAAAPLLQHCVRDLRNAEDLSLRHAAAQALEHLIAAAASAVDSSASAAEQAPVVLLVQRHLFAQLKRSVGHSNLAVRQEHLALVRRLALALPGVFGDLAPLTNANEDLDFWLSVSHLQLHRRAR